MFELEKTYILRRKYLPQFELMTTCVLCWLNIFHGVMEKGTFQNAHACVEIKLKTVC
jgi:hypothetical protein